MAKTAKNTVRLGIFVTVSIALFTAAIYYIGNQQNLFGTKYKISAQFNNVGGLRSGNNVRYAGINVGSVSNIVFVNDSTLQVDMQLNESVRGVIKKDAVASIGSDGLVGNVIVNITPGTGNLPPVEDGDFIASYSRVETDDILKTLGNWNENIAILSLNLLEITEKLNKGQGTLPRLISDPAMAKDIAMTLHNLRMTTETLRATGQQLKATVDHVNSGGGTIGHLLYDTTLVTQMEDFTVRLDTYIVNQTEPILADLQRTGEDLASSSAELKLALETLNRGEGLATTILRDTSAANDLKIILENLNEGTAKFSEDMEALKHNFLFRRYFKKQEKERKKQEKKSQN